MVGFQVSAAEMPLLLLPPPPPPPQVLRVNGTEVLNLAHLKQLIAAAATPGAPAIGQDAAATAAVPVPAPGNGAPPAALASAGDAWLESFDSDWDARFIRLELEDDRVIIMERAAADAATERLQRRYRVPYLCSADLVDV